MRYSPKDPASIPDPAFLLVCVCVTRTHVQAVTEVLGLSRAPTPWATGPRPPSALPPDAQ